MDKRTHSIEVIIGLLLFLTFTAAMLAVLMTGATSYQNISKAMEEQFSERTCLSYIVAKIRHFDTEGSIALEEFDGRQALTMDEVLDGEIYTTRIYWHDGYLYELYSIKDGEFTPEDGLGVLAIDSITFSAPQESLLKIECLSGGRFEEAVVSLRTGKAGDAA